MWTALLTTVNAVLPIILLILLGYVLKRIKFLTRDFIKLGNKLVFRVCLPCMLFINIYDQMDSFADIRWDVVLYSVVIILILFGFGLLTAILTTKQNKRRGVILQCVFRSNFAIIGLALADRLGGDGAVAGIVSAFSIPLFNVLAVIALTVFAAKEEGAVATVNEIADGTGVTAIEDKPSDGKFAEVKRILLNIIKNPLIIGVLVGLLFVGIREIEVASLGVTSAEIPFRFDTQFKFLYIAVKDVQAIASPLALIVLGGQFEFSAVKGMTKEIVVATVWRIVLAPLIGIGAALLLNKFTSLFTFGAGVYPTLVSLFGTPVAVSSAIMAGEMKNDEQLATQLVVWTSLGSIVTIFITVFALTSFGLIAV